MAQDSPAGAGIGQREPLPVYLAVWGFTGADVEHAVYVAQGAPGRRGWEFSEQRTTRFRDAVCPLDLGAGSLLAVDQGFHWAYVVALKPFALPGGQGSR